VFVDGELTGIVLICQQCCCVECLSRILDTKHMASSDPFQVSFIIVGCVRQMVSGGITIQGAPIKNNPLGKINYLGYCNRFFHVIYSFYRGGFRPHRQQISLQYLLWFKNYHYLNLKVHFSK